MALEYQIDAADGLIHVQGTAEIGLTDIFACGERLLADVAFDPHLPQLIDLREANIDPSCLQPGPASIFAHRFNSVVRASVAVVVAQGLARDEVAELYRVICMLDHAELFDEYEQALRWLIRTEFSVHSVTGG